MKGRIDLRVLSVLMVAGLGLSETAAWGASASLGTTYSVVDTGQDACYGSGQ